MCQKYLRNFCATINNYTNADESALKELEYSYCVIGFEGKDKTPHLQVYVELSKQTRFSTLKKLLPKAHIEPRRGTAEEAANYCKKEGSYEEFGEMSNQGKRNDLTHLVEKVKEQPKITRQELVENHTSIVARYPRFIQEVKSVYNIPTTLDWTTPPNLWVWGPPGTGKTSSYENGAYKKLINKWWCDYDNQDDVLLDDVDPDSMKYLTHHMKQWADRYPFRAEVKGGTILIRPQRIIVTSNYSINQCFFTEQDQLAIKRRFTVIHKVN